MFFRYSKFFVVCLMSTCLSAAWAMPGQMDQDPVVCGPESRSKHTQWFMRLNHQFIEDFQKSFQEKGDLFLGHHQDRLIPMAQFLARDMENRQNDEPIRHLRQQVLNRIEEKNVSPAWLYRVHVRYAVLLGKQGDAEVKFYKGIGDLETQEQLQNLFNKDALGRPVVLNDHTKEFDHLFSSHTSTYGAFPKGAMDALIKVMHARLPHLEYPLLGEDILDVRFLLNSWIHNIYPVPFPTTYLEGIHGIKGQVSPFGFAWHDHLHAAADHRMLWNASWVYLQERFQAIQRPGFSLLPAIQQGAPILMDKKDLFKKTVGQYLSHLGDSPQDQANLMGLFLVIHEIPEFSADLFKQETPEDLFQTLTQAARTQLDNAENWDNPADVLETDPVTGKTSLTDDQIKEKILKDLKNTGGIWYPEYTYKTTNEQGQTVWYDEEQKAKLEEAFRNPDKLEVTRLPDFVLATLTFENGETKSERFPTLYRKVNNDAANRSLLEAAGFTLPAVPEFNGTLEENRKSAIAFIQTRNDRLKQLIDGVKKDASQFFETSNFKTTYQETYQGIESRFDEVVKALTKTTN